MPKRAAVAFFYDERGIIDDYIPFLLSEIRKFVERIVFVSNGPLSKTSEIAVKQCVDELFIRKNEGFDVGAYLAGLEQIGFDTLDQYDEIILFDHTFYGPIFPFDEMFRTMDARECDFWGITAHKSAHNPFDGGGELPYYLNSHFIAVRRSMGSSLAFRHYWASLPPIKTYEDSILIHGSQFTKHFMDLGYRHSVYINPDDYGSNDPAFIDVDETLRNHCPILKRRIFYHDPIYNEENAIDLPRALAIVEKESAYDPNLIWKNIVRACQLRDLNATAGLMDIFPDVRLLPEDAPIDYGRIAVCAHVYYTEMLEELFALTANMPVPYDFIATTDTLAKKEDIERAAAGRLGIKNVIVRVMDENRGRDMAALFVTCRDIFLEDRYDIVCRLHTKKSPQVSASKSNLFKRHMFENLLASRGYVTNVLDMFKARPWIGLALPSIVHIGFATLGHSWYVNRSRAEELKKILDLSVAFDADTPVAPYGTMFWFRPPALRKLFLHPWQMKEFNAEPNHVDGGLAHTLERLIAYVAQDASYITQHIMSSRLAAWNYTMLELKLDRLQSKLPLSYLAYQIHFLSERQTENDELRRHIGHLEAELQQLGRLEAELQQRQTEIDELRRHVGHLEAELQQRQTEIDELRRHVARLEAELYYHHMRHVDRIDRLREVASILNSTSWRVTLPLRLMSRLRGRRGTDYSCIWEFDADQLAQTAAALRRSKSWRITAPLRRLRGG